jgi:hypothetical protein
LRVVVMSATIGDALATRLVGVGTTSATKTVGAGNAAANENTSATASDDPPAVLTGVAAVSAPATEPGKTPKLAEVECLMPEVGCLMPHGRLLTSRGRAFPVDVKYLGRGGSPMAAKALKPRELEAQVRKVEVAEPVWVGVFF